MLASSDLQKDVHPFYKLYSQPLVDNNARINFLKELGTNYDAWKTLSSIKNNLSLIQPMVKNVLEGIAWEDTEALNNIEPWVLQMSHMPEFQKVISEGTKGFKIQNLDFEQIKNFLMKFKQIEFLDLENNYNIKGNISWTSEFKDLKKLSLASAFMLKGFSGIENLSNLQELNLNNTTYFEELTFEKVHGLLRKISLEGSGISKITGLQNVINLEEINLKNTNFSQVPLEGPLQTLRKVYLNKSEISTIKDLLVNTPNIEELDLSGTRRLPEIVFEEPLEKLKKLSLAESEISELSGLQNVKNLKEINLNFTFNLSKLLFTERYEKLERLSLISSGISSLNGVDNLENLKDLNLEDARSITHLKVGKENKDLVLKLKGSGIRSRADIDGLII
ncbi:MAG: hypothetical protein H0X26_09475 [Alphaproteobacteria bacterium]|nr:hypothetical protein [Alphaproteobacteria bacterium]